MTDTNNSPLLLRADQEHSGIRTAVLILLFFAIITLFIIIRVIWSALSPEGLPDFAFLMTCGLSLVIGLALVYVVEQILKRSWPSGRTLLLDEAAIQTQNKEGANITIKWAHDTVRLSWWFHLKGFQRGGRERRVPNNWVCVATQLQELDNRIIAYTYLPPKKATQWMEDETNIHQIYPSDVYKSSLGSRVNLPSRPDIPAKVLAGKDGKYWQAERARWVHGYELVAKDFEKLMDFVASH